EEEFQVDEDAVFELLNDLRPFSPGNFFPEEAFGELSVEFLDVLPDYLDYDCLFDEYYCFRTEQMNLSNPMMRVLYFKNNDRNPEELRSSE
ncbi:MAG: hypothetical protein VKJ24_03310, partial [Synechococcales bacterium]|nr:hypothetical protein [Synechococcales bacterium]